MARTRRAPRRLPAYEAFVTGLAKQWQGRPGVIFDPWNEPNCSDFWTGTETRQLETFRHTHDVIRRVVGTEAVIAGPSLERRRSAAPAERSTTTAGATRRPR